MLNQDVYRPFTSASSTLHCYRGSTTICAFFRCSFDVTDLLTARILAVTMRKNWTCVIYIVHYTSRGRSDACPRFDQSDRRPSPSKDIHEKLSHRPPLCHLFAAGRLAADSRIHCANQTNLQSRQNRLPGLHPALRTQRLSQGADFTSGAESRPHHLVSRYFHLAHCSLDSLRRVLRPQYKRPGPRLRRRSLRGLHYHYQRCLLLERFVHGAG